jgi:hypothetical protein
MNTTSAHRPPAVAILLVPVAVSIVLTLFAWPSARMAPRELPVGVAGPPRPPRPSSSGSRRATARRSRRAAARRAIEDREVYGAFVATPSGAKVLTASAASPAVAQQLTHAAAEGQAESVPHEDVVAAPPAGSALAVSVLPLVIGGILTGVVAAAITANGLGRIGLLVAGSVLAGLAATAIVQSRLDVVGGHWAANAGALSLTVPAVASASVPCSGRRGWSSPR